MKAQARYSFFPPKWEQLLNVCTNQCYRSPPVMVLHETLAITNQQKGYDKAFVKAQNSIFLTFSFPSFVRVQSHLFSVSSHYRSSFTEQLPFSFTKENQWIKTKCLYQDHSRWRTSATAELDKRNHLSIVLLPYPVGSSH